MSEPQFALIVLAVVRVGIAIAVLDLYWRLKTPSAVPIGVGLSVYALTPTLTLVLGGGDHDPRTVVLEAIALALMATGFVAHFRPVELRTTFAIAGVAAMTSLLGAAALPQFPHASDVVFLVASLLATVGIVRHRRLFKRTARGSYHWALVICAVASVMYATHLFADQVEAVVFADRFLSILVSVQIGLYLLSLEFNIAHTQLNNSESRYRTLFDAAGDSILVSDFDGTIIDANAGTTDLLGYSGDELRGRPISSIDDPESAQLVEERLDGIRRDGRAVFETTQVRKDGSPVPVEVNAVRIVWDGRDAVLGIVRDLSERKAAELLVTQMAYYDPLTGLANRTLFKDRLERALVRSQRSGRGFTLLFLDLDHFKVVNDTLGHPAGDRLLSAVGERLRELVREGDTVARLGGDEYTLLLPDTSTHEDAAKVAWKVLEALRAPFSLDVEHDVHATASIGIALATGAEESPDSLIRNADIAMFRAKDRGRDQYQFFDPEMNTASADRDDMKNELREAQAHDELELCFQPQFRMRDRRIMGAEALLRWRNPSRGVVEPLELIPLAEESGLIVPMGQWVIREACRRAHEWHRAGFDGVRVSVNLSARQLIETDLASFVSDTLSEFEIPPTGMELEVPESVAMQDTGALLASLKRLSETGVRIAIDNFGTGCSSLDQLERLPVTTLKVARCFVEDIGEVADSSAIATTIVVLGQGLGLNVIAEGVQTQQQFDVLNSLGCDEMQGFLLSPPISAEQFLSLLADEVG